MFKVKIPNYFNNQTCPQPSEEAAAQEASSVKSMYPNADVTPKKIRVALLLSKICDKNYEQCGHWFVETTAIYEEDSKGNLSECFYKYVVEAGGNPQKALDILTAELSMFADYAADISDTAF